MKKKICFVLALVMVFCSANAGIVDEDFAEDPTTTVADKADSNCTYAEFVTDVADPDYTKPNWLVWAAAARAWRWKDAGGVDDSGRMSKGNYNQASSPSTWMVVKNDKTTKGIVSLKFDVLFNAAPDGSTDEPEFGVSVWGITNDATEEWNGHFPLNSGSFGGSTSYTGDDGTELLAKSSGNGDFAFNTEYEAYEFLVDLGDGYDWIAVAFVQGGISADGYDCGIDNVKFGKTAEAINPDPTDGEIMVELDFSARSVPGSLSWEAPADPLIESVVDYTIYVDPNMAKVEARDTDCLFYSADFAVNSFAPGTDLSYSETYYWAVDTEVTADFNDPNVTFEPLVPGSVWQFTAVVPAPVVEVGDNVVATLAQAQAGLDITGSVYDDDDDVVLIQWSVLTDAADYPGGVQSFGDDSAPVTTFTTDTEGRFVLQLMAQDAADQTDDSILEVMVYADPCEAAKNNPNGYQANAYDFDEDCDVDVADFAKLAEQWLADTTLQAPETYQGDVVYP